LVKTGAVAIYGDASADGAKGKSMDVNQTGDVTIYRPAIALTGRLLFTLIFFLSGITHFTRFRSAPSG
jgi:hypothetical protein